MASLIERLLFPEGDFQNIRATSPDQRTYNIEATKDLVENLPGGVVRDLVAPAAAGIMSPFYDAIQAAQRMQPGSGVSGFVDAFKAENPLSSAFERMTGAAGPLYDRLSNFSAPSLMSTAQAATTNPNEPLDIKNFLGSVEACLALYNLKYQDTLPLAGTVGTLALLSVSISAKGKLILQDLIKGKGIDAESSGLSKREWNELMTAFDLKDKLI